MVYREKKELIKCLGCVCLIITYNSDRMTAIYLQSLWGLGSRYPGTAATKLDISACGSVGVDQGQAAEQKIKEDLRDNTAGR